MNANEITWVLVCGNNSIFSFKKYYSIPNVSYGFFKDREVDLLVVSKANYLTEIEIKISLSDLKKDSEKFKFQKERSNLIKDFYYAMPEKLWDKIKDNPPIPEYAGVIVVTNKSAKLIRKSQSYNKAKKITDLQLMKLYRLSSFRYWSICNILYWKKLK